MDETPDGWTRTVLDGLAAQAKGEPVDEDAMAQAGTILLGVLLANNGGLSIDAIEELFQRDYELHFSWDPEVGLKIVADFEGQQVTATKHMAEPERCAACGQVAGGWAFINGKRYCHGDDDPTPTCYMKGSAEEAHGAIRDVIAAYEAGEL